MHLFAVKFACSLSLWTRKKKNCQLQEMITTSFNITENLKIFLGWLKGFASVFFNKDGNMFTLESMQPIEEVQNFSSRHDRGKKYPKKNCKITILHKTEE